MYMKESLHLSRKGAAVFADGSWANTDITDAELGLTGYVMFRRD